MYLIQILLPLYSNEGVPFPSHQYNKIKKELADRFGGITTYTRSPASGLWKESESSTVKDDIVIYEVMVQTLDEVWWKDYKLVLEKDFKQDELIIRATPLKLL